VSHPPILSVNGLVKHYGRTEVLNGVSFDLEPGSIVALVGTNGAGKTTAFKCILGLTDFRGEIDVAGRSVVKHGKEVRGLIGYLPQAPGFGDDDTCFEALRFLADLRRAPHDRIGTLLDRVSLGPQRDKRIRELSGGMRQRLSLAAALLSDPPLLLLDEPTGNLDFQSRRELHDLLGEMRDEGKTVVLSTHFVEHIADLADRVILLKDGKVGLDMATSELTAAAGRRVTVSLNGTAPSELLAALGAIGIGEQRISAAASDLQEAISRAMAASTADEEARG